MATGIDFVLVTPTHRYIESQTTWSVEVAHLHALGKGIHFLWAQQPGDALISRSRSVACSQFLKLNYAPYMIFLDSDIVFKPDDLFRLYEHMKAGYDLIGGHYSVRGGTMFAHYRTNGHWPIDGKIHEVRFLSTGFMGISRRLLEKMRDDLKMPLLHEGDWAECYPFFESHRYQVDGKWVFLSEDWDFCEKAREVGATPYVDTSIQLEHIGLKTYTIADVVAHQKEAAGTNSPALAAV